MAEKKIGPLDRRPCRDNCGQDVILAQRIPTGKWRALDATPVTDDRMSFAMVLVGSQAWRRGDLLEHYVVSREISEDKARELVDTYPHHLLHVHDDESEGDQ